MNLNISAVKDKLYKDLAHFKDTVLSSRGSLSRNETQTKLCLILPFIKALGFNIHNPSEVQSEFSSDIAGRKGEKVDLALFIDGVVKMIIECKCLNANLDDECRYQLARYFPHVEAQYAVLTNGETYKFYSDTLTPNNIDHEPFFEINISKIEESDVNRLIYLHKDNFKPEVLVEEYKQKKEEKIFYDYLLNEFKNPDEDFLKYIIKKSGVFQEGKISKSVINKYKFSIRNSLKRFIISKQSENSDPPPPPPQKPDGFVFQSNTYNVNKWYDIIVKLSEIIYTNNKDDFYKAERIQGANRKYFSLNKSDLSNPKPILDSGWHVETSCFTSNQVYKFCFQMLDLFGYKRSDFHILGGANLPPLPPPISGTKPKSFVFQGVDYPVNSWKNVLIKLSEIIYKSHSKDFYKTNIIKGTKRQYFSTDKSKMTSPGLIPNTNWYVEANFNKEYIIDICYQLLDLFEYNRDDFKVNC